MSSPKKRKKTGSVKGSANKTVALTLAEARKLSTGKLRLNKNAKCVRNVANWSTVKQTHRLDSDKYSGADIRKVLTEVSPKITALISNIIKLDRKDMKEHGKKFKHFIFSDVRGLSGIKIVGSALLATGFNLAMRPGNKEVDIAIPKGTVKTTGSNNFVLLTSTPLFGLPITDRTKRKIIGKTGIFNSRKPGIEGNVHGEQIRIVVGDSGFKEGVDLFDVKYVHILEPQLSSADFTQAVGRATRTCGQSSLQFVPDQGWILEVFEYDLALPPNKKGAKTAHELMLNVGKVDVSQTRTISEIQNLALQSAVDRDLNLSINFFGKEPEKIAEFQQEFEDITGRRPASIKDTRRKKKGVLATLFGKKRR